MINGPVVARDYCFAMNISLFEQLALALGLAFFFGLAFEDYYGRAKEARPGGVRTFPLLALAGAVLYVLDRERLIPLTAGLLCVGAWLAIYYFRRAAETNVHGEAAVGLMVPVCNVIAFLLGPAALAEPPWLPAGVTAAAVLLLTNRDRLHRFARDIEIPELVTAGKFLVLTGLILPLLPDHAVSNITNITPRQAWLALVTVSAISYASYLLQRYVMPRGAVHLYVAVLGGLYSSTATAVAFARQLRDGERNIQEMQAGILISTAVMYLRVLAVVAIFDVSLAARLLTPALGLSALAVGAGVVWYRRKREEPAPHAATSPLNNPLALSTATVFAVLFVAISMATAWVRAHFGPSGLYALAGLVGFADVDPFVLNLAEGGAQDITASVATAAIVLATSSNNFLKATYVALIAGRQRGFRPAVALAIMGALGIATAALVA